MNYDIFRNRIFTRTLVTLCATFILLTYCNVLLAVEPETKSKSLTPEIGKYSVLGNQNAINIPKKVASNAMSKYSIIDPHWDREQCGTCHNGTPTKENTKLHIRDVNKLCQSCHQYVPDNLLNHPTDQKPSKAMLSRMPAEYKKTLNSKYAKPGTVSCLTCHEVLLQCTPAKFFNRSRNHEFFRSGPFRRRTDQCFKCHDKNKFKRFNPHEQITKSGKVKKNTCFVCHEEVDKLDTLKDPDNLKFIVTDYSKMCIGCHLWVPHPGGELSSFSFSRSNKKKSNHLVRASDLVLIQMKSMLSKENYYMPLEPKTGKVHCATCHNVHQKGVIKDKIKAKGANSKKMLRKQQMCILCHPI